MKKVDFNDFRKDVENFIFSEVKGMRKVENEFDDTSLSLLGKELHNKIKDKYSHNLDYLFVNVKAVIRDIMFYPDYAFSNIDAIVRNIYYGIKHKVKKNKIILDFKDYDVALQEIKALNVLYNLKIDNRINDLKEVKVISFDNVKIRLFTKFKKIIIVS